jgi:peptidoglycan biosynthesis protein MviN/MurJ (putative lipid II flippase)
MLKGNPFVVQGFEIPSDSPFFLTILSIHILAALTCVITGVMAMLIKKQAGLHPKSGTIYFWSLLIVFITATIMAVLRWKEDYHLFIFGLIAFSSALIGRTARRNIWEKWSIIHIIGMGASYIFLLIAFYVDNGRFLPLWKNLNPIIYWLLPALVGVPIIIRTLLRHPLSRNYFTRN